MHSELLAKTCWTVRGAGEAGFSAGLQMRQAGRPVDMWASLCTGLPCRLAELLVFP